MAQINGPKRTMSWVLVSQSETAGKPANQISGFFKKLKSPVTGFSTHDFRKISGKPNVMSGSTNSGKSGINR